MSTLTLSLATTKRYFGFGNSNDFVVLKKRSDDWTHHAYPQGPEGHPWFWTITAVEFPPSV
jgi:hypothetical protein